MSNYNKQNDECTLFRKLVSAYVDGQTGEAETRRLSDHASSCRSCKRELANLYAMRDMIKSAYASKGDIDFSASIMARINPVKRGDTIHHIKKYSDRALRYGAAAVLLIAVVCGTIIYSQFQTRSKMAEKRKFDTYMIEHAEQYARGETVAASVISVSFEK